MEYFRAILIRRYKRFLADVCTPDGQRLTLHCPNTGRMTGCGEPGDTIYYSLSANPKRKYPGTWELTHSRDGHWIGVNTARANRLVANAVTAGHLPALAGYSRLQHEVRLGNSRLDLCLHADDKPVCYVEIKSVTLAAAGGLGYFPDAPSKRGQKHLQQLMALAAQGHRAVLLFCIQHSAIDKVAPADHIDADYAHLLRQAARQGVEILACKRRFEQPRDEHLLPASVQIM